MTEARSEPRTTVTVPPEGRIVSIDPERDPRWGPWVSSRPDGLVYHHPAWVRAIRLAYGYECACLGYEDRGGRLRGVLPLLARSGVLSGRGLSSLPHTPIAGPLAEHPEVAAHLLRAALERVRAGGVRLQVKSRSPRLADSVTGLSSARWDDTYVIELPEHVEELRFGSSRNNARIRWAQRKAAKEGVTVRVAEREDDLRAWYGLYLETMRSHGVPPRPYRLFHAMWELLWPSGMMRLLIAERVSGGRRRLMAGSIVLSCGRTATYAFNGRRREDLALRPNDVIQWTAIAQLCAEGVRSYDLGEVATTQAGLAEFKSKWGARPLPLYRYHHPPGKGIEAAGPLAPRAGTRRAGEAIWRRLPLPVTARVGDWFYRYL